MVKVDLLIKNAQVFNSITQDFYRTNVTVLNGKFYWLIQDDSDVKADQILDLSGKFIIPGLVDSHMHIESSMTTPKNFGEAVKKFGTTTIIADAHEIANVAGMQGLKSYMNQKSPIDIFYAIPSSVPSTNTSMETTGGTIGVDEVEELLKDPRIICLGEAMNFQGLTSEPHSLIRQIIEVSRSHRPTMPLEGHCPKYTGLDLAKFIYSGVTSDHTQQTAESIVEKVMNGMFIQLQRKSLNPEVVSAIEDNQLFEHIGLVTDDVMPDDLKKGHLNQIVKLAIKNGMDPRMAIYIATYTPARRMGLWDRGSILPGRIADFIVLDQLDNFKINSVYKNGLLVDDTSEVREQFEFDRSLVNSIEAPKIEVKDLELRVSQENGQIKANVIQISQQGTFTKKVLKELDVVEHVVQWQKADLALLMVQERYGNGGQISFGLVEKAINQNGAIGATWAHDHHNVMILGTDLNSMVVAQHKLIEEQGGYVVVRQGAITANVPLPVGGVVSEVPIDVLGGQVEKLRNEMRKLGYVNSNEIMSFSTLSLLVSPDLKISDKGLFDVKSQKMVPLFETD